MSRPAPLLPPLPSRFRGLYDFLRGSDGALAVGIRPCSVPTKAALAEAASRPLHSTFDSLDKPRPGVGTGVLSRSPGQNQCAEVLPVDRHLCRKALRACAYPAPPKLTHGQRRIRRNPCRATAEDRTHRRTLRNDRRLTRVHLPRPTSSGLSSVRSVCVRIVRTSRRRCGSSRTNVITRSLP